MAAGRKRDAERSDSNVNVKNPNYFTAARSRLQSIHGITPPYDKDDRKVMHKEIKKAEKELMDDFMKVQKCHDEDKKAQKQRELDYHRAVLDAMKAMMKEAKD